MKSLGEIKQEREDKVTDLIKECSMFFAFSNEQFATNKTPLAEGDKYVHLGAGAYMPKSKVDSYISGTEAIDKWYRAAVKDNKLRRQNIIYELGNHEAWYTNDIEDTLEALGSDYTAAEVREVFNTEYANQTA